MEWVWLGGVRRRGIGDKGGMEEREGSLGDRLEQNTQSLPPRRNNHCFFNIL